MSLEEPEDETLEGLVPGPSSEYHNAHRKNKSSPDRQSPCFSKADVLSRAQTCQTSAIIRSGALPWLASHYTMLISHPSWPKTHMNGARGDVDASCSLSTIPGSFHLVSDEEAHPGRSAFIARHRLTAWSHHLIVSVCSAEDVSVKFRSTRPS